MLVVVGGMLAESVCIGVSVLEAVGDMVVESVCVGVIVYACDVVKVTVDVNGGCSVAVLDARRDGNTEPVPLLVVVAVIVDTVT